MILLLKIKLFILEFNKISFKAIQPSSFKLLTFYFYFYFFLLDKSNSINSSLFKNDSFKYSNPIFVILFSFYCFYLLSKRIVCNFVSLNILFNNKQSSSVMILTIVFFIYFKITIVILFLFVIKIYILQIYYYFEYDFLFLFFFYFYFVLLLFKYLILGLFLHHYY
jgi:hypothetical protein